jgi:hypothetical protein
MLQLYLLHLSHSELALPTAGFATVLYHSSVTAVTEKSITLDRCALVACYRGITM